MLELPRSGSERITLAYRENGNTIDTGAGEGVQVHLTTQGAYHQSTLIDPSSGTTGKDDTDLNVGARITDATSGVTIETVSATATSATVRITTNAGQRYVDSGGRCLDVEGANTANGTRIIAWTCTGATNQRWTSSSDGILRSLGK
ncbi:ricin-type beta-trefoil lectin domain protein [Actinokineospora sp. HUAS TT18]|uniref:ricin-type beta-trefoil lectin domain protein n=1 Tax=Actinokineospora sp. HUAS TT18 TaxID=3447451 RepID=UPI003F523F77